MAIAETAKLIAQLVLDDKMSAGLSKASNNVQTFAKVTDRAGRGLRDTANNLAKLGTIGGGLVVTGLALSIKAASDLNEQVNKTTTVFGKASKEVLDFSKTTAGALGLSQSEALEAAGNFGNMFNTIGLAQDQSASFSKTLVTLASDMASFNNEDPTEMLDRLRSGLSGEAEPLRRFGILLSEAAVQQEAYATGIAKTGDKLTEAQKVQARYSLILKQTKVQQGDFARTSGGLANQMRILRANFQDAGATIGTALLPKITEIAVKINRLIKDNQPAIIAFANTLPAAFDKAVAFAEKIPWATIGAGLEKAAFFAGKLFDIFTSLPPEVQTTLIALAGLNKLSGGAISGIVGELGKGLIKGVLGINAGVVNINAATVNGGGGGIPGAVGGAAAGLGGAAVGVGLTGLAIIGGIQAGLATVAGQVAGEVGKQIQSTVGAGPVNVFGPIDRLISAFQGDFRSPLEKVEQSTKVLGPKLEGVRGQISQADVRAAERQEAIRAATVQAGFHAQQASTGERAALGMISRQQDAIKAATVAAGTSETAAINRAAADAAAKAAAQKAAVSRIGDKFGELRGAVLKQKPPVVNVKVSQSLNLSGIAAGHQTYKSIYRVAS